MLTASAKYNHLKVVSDPLDSLAVELYEKLFANAPKLSSLEPSWPTVGGLGTPLKLFAWRAEKVKLRTKHFGNEKPVECLGLHRICIHRKLEKGIEIYFDDTRSIGRRDKLSYFPFLVKGKPNLELRELLDTFCVLPQHPDLPNLSVDDKRAAIMFKAFGIAYRIQPL